MNWIPLQESSQLKVIDEASQHKPILIFKHSTRCSISKVALSRLEKEDKILSADCYYLDLLKHRDISNQIAEHYQIHHESPQVLLIKNGTCVYDESHMNITWDDLEKETMLLM